MGSPRRHGWSIEELLTVTTVVGMLAIGALLVVTVGMFVGVATLGRPGAIPGAAVALVLFGVWIVRRGRRED